MHDLLQSAANQAGAMGPAILVQGRKLQRPADLIDAASLSVDDRRRRNCRILTIWRPVTPQKCQTTRRIVKCSCSAPDVQTKLNNSNL